MTFRKGLRPGKVIKVAPLQASVGAVRPEAEVDLADPEADRGAGRSSFHEGAGVADLRRAQPQARKDKELLRSGERSA